MLGRFLKRVAVIVFPLCVMTAGCQNPDASAANHLPRPLTARQTFLIELTGMGGWTSADVNCVRGLSEGGVADHVEIYDWTTPHSYIGAVLAYDHNRAAARYIAERITAKKRESPQAQIVLVAWSPARQLPCGFWKICRMRSSCNRWCLFTLPLIQSMI